MAQYHPRVVRFSLDLDVEQKNFLKLYAAKAEVSSSIVLRALIHLLQTSPELSDQVLDLIFVAVPQEAEYLDEDDQ